MQTLRSTDDINIILYSNITIIITITINTMFCVYIIYNVYIYIFMYVTCRAIASLSNYGLIIIMSEFVQLVRSGAYVRSHTHTRLRVRP